MSELLIPIIFALIALAIGYFVGQFMLKNSNADKEAEAQIRAEQILENAKQKADGFRRDKQLEAKEHFLQLKSQFEDDSNRKKQIIIQNEQKVKQMQQQAAQLLEQNKRKEKELEVQSEKINDQTIIISKRKEEADKLLQQQVEQLEKVAQLSAEQAKQQLIDALRGEAESKASS